VSKPKLLDLFCGAGGAARGYQRAGFYVVGIDNRPQPHYVGDEFIQADALEYVAAHGQEFDVIHASPPCQGYSQMRYLKWLHDREYPLLIPETRAVLQTTNALWVIENVSNSPLMGAELCGAALGLPIRRHRRFESNILLLFPPCPGHTVMYAGKSQMSQRGRNGGIMGIPPDCDPRRAMNVEWMSLRETRQTIPPAYTEFIGRFLMEAIS